MVYSRKQINTALQNHSESVEGRLSTSVYDEMGFRPSRSTIMRYYDKWNDALTDAGVLKKGLLEDLKRADRRVDGSITYRQMADMEDMPSPTTYQRHFRGWNEAKRKAGLEINRHC